mgnify:CR=1 FL=1
MTTFARTLDRQRPARVTSPIPGLVAALLTALLWSNVARADLDQLEWFNPATLEQLVRSAAKLTIGNDETVNFDITIR